MIRLKKYAAQTFQGPFFNINEDDYDVDIEKNLFCVFDGFGGSGIGDQGVALLKQSINRFFTRFGGDQDSTMPFYYNPKFLLEGNALVNAVHFGHKSLYELNSERSIATRAGASMVGVALSENTATIVSIGSCNGFLYRAGKISQVCNPETMGNFFQDQIVGRFPPPPLNGLGLFEELHLNISEWAIQEGDCLLLMTDGLYGYLGKGDILHSIERGSESLQDQVDEYLALANRRGNIDNQTAVILQF